MTKADELSDWLAGLPLDWTAGCSPAAFVRARAEYASPLRHYHDWRHVQSCVAHLASFACDRPRTIFLALVFHDSVYVAGRSDNEARSAELARNVLSAGGCASDAELDAIDRLIRATNDHRAHSSTTDRDLAVMLDVDLAILGAPRDEYARYARAIHDEYVPSATTEARFRMGRLEFLQRIGASPRVFITSDASERWESRARANIAWEIDILKREQGFVERAVSVLRRS